jgi:F-type H+-transporting ATPase subunit O
LNPSIQALDNKTLSRLETAVSKSSYVGQGQKLKVTNTVRLSHYSFPLDVFQEKHPSPFVSSDFCPSQSRERERANTKRAPQKVNPDIVGGLVVEVGNRTIDLSVSARIAKMNKLLTGTL